MWSRSSTSSAISAILLGYEIQQSHKRRNGLLGVYIHNLKDINGQTDTMGANPFDSLHIEYPNGSKELLSSLYPTYNLVNYQGLENLGAWVEQAAKNAGK